MIRTLLRLFPHDRRGDVVRYTVLAVVGVVLRAVGVVLLVPLVSALFGDDPGGAWPWVGALTAVTAAGWAVDAVTARLGFDLGFGLLDSTQRDVAERLTRVRLTWFTAENTATARQAIAATGPEIVGLVVNLLTPLIGATLLPIGIALALLPVSAPLGLAALAGVPVLLGAFWASTGISRRADTVAAETNSAFTERILEFARTQQALRAARRVEPARSHAGAALAAQHGATMRLLLMQIPGQLLFSLASQLALVLLAGTATALAVRGDLGVPETVALIVVVARYLEPFTALGELSPAVESVQTTLRRVNAVLTAPVVPHGTDLPSGIPGATPRIEFENVTFRYAPHEKPVLDGLSFTLEPGTTTAIVGPSGSGKSTILALIAGLHEPDSGRVLINGTDPATLTPEARRALTSVVFQHPYLFTGTLRDNIRTAHPEATEPALAQATHLSRVDDLTSRFPEALNTKVGEAGTTLSGGERQRVAIARALLKPAPILLVDEATSALDTENESLIAETLTSDPHPRTRVVVAHRLTSIRHAHRVIFLEDGKITEDGPAHTLLAQNGRFTTFWHHQSTTPHWRLTPT
ncbi:ABC transporter ATP-binding protein/permease [Actinocorallia sp. API 0066]|uniref:ABC transporter ATP-binding protein n=1 Tax=Actinocorallia sp. API 0066 TaxID=2896846 RepID=UPI001E2A79F7|nr:ABC transporter ATP-binding protein [Actinocorallia sp. API 0066]MCD0453201.1 ABC transporter ATP-binding protein/permease [Actinocorallia sp. API 0066]